MIKFRFILSSSHHVDCFFFTTVRSNMKTRNVLRNYSYQLNLFKLLQNQTFLPMNCNAILKFFLEKCCHELTVTSVKKQSCEGLIQR